jgi:ubiquinone/menaquinone biosynthesis C-methylase UbiE
MKFFPFALTFLGLDRPRWVPYWFRSDIHTIGNTGAGGALHAAIAPSFTTHLDDVVYKKNVRRTLCQDLSTHSYRTIVDLGCGTGSLTRDLWYTWPNATVLGFDTSPEMLSMANVISHCSPCDISYQERHAETTGLDSSSIDLVTLSFVLHEVPSPARSRILHEARRVLRPGGDCVIMDIAPDYTPSRAMLMGEPFIEDFLRNIQQEVFLAFTRVRVDDMVPGHVRVWHAKKM